MECSSHAIVQERTRGLHFAGGIFSNITHDHLDYHKTFAEYIRAKKLFFDSLSKEAFALTNADDKNGRVMVQNTAAAIHTYSLRSMADFRCKIVEMHRTACCCASTDRRYGSGWWAASTPTTCWPYTARPSCWASTAAKRCARRACCTRSAAASNWSGAQTASRPSSITPTRPTRSKT